MDPLAQDLTAAAEDEMERALSLGWRDLARHTPWGDTFEGFTPAGREAAFERNYLWEGESGGDIRVEIAVYPPHAFENGVRLVQRIPKPS